MVDLGLLAMHSVCSLSPDPSEWNWKKILVDGALCKSDVFDRQDKLRRTVDYRWVPSSLRWGTGDTMTLTLSNRTRQRAKTVSTKESGLSSYGHWRILKRSFCLVSLTSFSSFGPSIARRRKCCPLWEFQVIPRTILDLISRDFKSSPFTANAKIVGIGATNTCSASTASDHGSCGVPPYTTPGITDELAVLPMQEGALEWDSSSSTLDRTKWGKEALKDAHPGVRAVRSDADLPLMCEPSERVGVVSPMTEGVGHPPKSEDSKGTSHKLRLQGQEPGSARDKWEFTAGEGIFSKDDEGLAARREPTSNHRERASAQRDFLPLGLQASSTDELTVYIYGLATTTLQRPCRYGTSFSILTRVARKRCDLHYFCQGT